MTNSRPNPRVMLSHWGISVLACAVMSHGPMQVVGADNDLPAIPLESQVIQERERIIEGIVEIKSELKSHRVGGDAKVTSRAFTVWFDNDRVRQDEVQQYEAPVMGENEFRESVAHVNGQILFYSNERFADDGKMIASIRDDEQVSAAGLFQIPDVRLIGMVPSSYKNLVHYASNSILGNPQSQLTETSEEERDGLLCNKFTFRKYDNVKIDVWISPERGFNIVAVEARSGGIEDSVICKLVEVDEYGWFPSQVQYTRHKQGQLVKSERLIIKVVQFNQPIDDDVFTFAGMGVPRGYKVVDYTADTDRGSVMYTASADGLVPVQPGEGVRPNLPDIGIGDFKKWLLIANAITFAAIAVAILWWRRRRRIS